MIPGYLRKMDNLLAIDMEASDGFSTYGERLEDELVLSFDETTPSSPVIALDDLSGLNVMRLSFSGRKDHHVTLVGTRVSTFPVLEVDVAPSTRADLLFHLSTRTAKKGVVRRNFRLGEDSFLTITNGLFVTGKLLLEDEIFLEGEHAELSYDLLAVGNGSDHIEIAQHVHHRRKTTVSNLSNQLVASDGSRVEVLVSGTIDKGMEGSSCKQSNRGVILGEKGQIRVDPKLFINEYDVEARHGAAIGQLNDDEMFYLLSRGLTEEEAKRLIVSGYTNPYLNVFPDGPLKQAILKRLNQKLKGVNS